MLKSQEGGGCRKAKAADAEKAKKAKGGGECDEVGGEGQGDETIQGQAGGGGQGGDGRPAPRCTGSTPGQAAVRRRERSRLSREELQGRRRGASVGLGGGLGGGVSSTERRRWAEPLAIGDRRP